MVFSSVIFLGLFLPLVLLGYYFPMPQSVRRTWRNVFLLLASLFFYAWGEPVFVFIMLFSITLNFFFAKLIGEKTDSSDHRKRKTWLVVAITWNVALLFVFKYLGFVAKTLNYLPFTNLPSIEIALPIGISFFSFQIMSYLFDLYYGKVQVQQNWARLALYISLFPQLVAGPIVRYDAIENSITNRTETAENFTLGMQRFIIGLAKKCIIANYVAIIADKIYTFPLEDLTFVDSWIGAIAYTLQIYFDFSGYSDMAIGLGLMFGFRFKENFNYPYTASSITDFWRKWHISLSSWFRDYVYIPLGGNRCSKSRWILNLFVVWLLTGIWHGANWTFIVWGLYYLVFLLIEKLTPLGKQSGFFMHLYALIVITIGWVFFRSPDMEFAMKYLRVMLLPFCGDTDFGMLWNNYYLVNGGTVFFAAILFSFPIVPFIGEKLAKLSGKTLIVAEVVKSLLLVAMFVISILLCIKSTYNPFIYFNF